MKNSSFFSLSEGAWYRGFIQGKTRIAMAWVFSAVLVLMARQQPTWPGIALCFVGALLRFWASGYLRKDSRPAVGGPYAFTRNPLYLGTYLMAAGAALSIESYGFLAGLSIAYIAVYHYIILDEETKLHKIFGAPYSTYCALVPRFFPRPWRPARASLMQVNPEIDHHHFSWDIARKNKAFEPFWSFVGLIGVICLVAALWQYFGQP